MFFCGAEKIFSFAFAFLGQQGVLADHEPLARIVGRGDLRQILLVEQRELYKALLEQLLDGGVPQRRDLEVAASDVPGSLTARSTSCDGEHAAGWKPV